MKRTFLLCAVVVFLSLSAFAQNSPLIPDLARESSQVVPAKVLQAKTAIVWVHWANAPVAAVKEVQKEAEDFVKSWGRYSLVGVESKADLIIAIEVQPIEREPGAAKKWYSSWAQSGNAVYVPPGPETVLTGAILLFDPAEVRARAAANSPDKPEPLLFAVSDTHGGKPLKSAGKKLRKMIDAATKPK